MVEFDQMICISELILLYLFYKCQKTLTLFLMSRDGIYGGDSRVVDKNAAPACKVQQEEEMHFESRKLR